MTDASTYLTQIQHMSVSLQREIARVPDDVFNQRPGPHLNTIGWNYFHVLRLWDFDLNWVCNGQKMSEDAWHRGDFSGQTGYNPDGRGTRGLGVGYGYTDEEVDELNLTAEALAPYHELLMAETAAFLTDADDDEMQRQARLVLNPDQTTSVATRMQHLIHHSFSHIGEILFIRGMFGTHDPSYDEAITRAAIAQ